jgi:D-alanyl-D-alanine carboxypeptidase
LAFLLEVFAALSVVQTPADAAIRHRRWQPHWQSAQAFSGALTDPLKDAALVVDGSTGRVLYARNADALRHPASLTKMMTLYLLFEQLRSGQMTMVTPIPVSWHASIQAPTKLHVRPGTTVPVETAIKSLVVLSANDMAVAIAEAIGGSEDHFAELMTQKARQLGMVHTFYHNASGLPDDQQITTASDLAILARHLAYDFPQYFHYFSTYSFSYRNATYYTHDNLIGRYQGADGIKTGYTGASGFNLVSSVVRDGTHIIGIVMGGTSAHRRDTEMMRLLDDTFASIGRNPQLVARANVPWQAIAQNTQTAPVIAGFQLGSTLLPTPVPAPPPPFRTAGNASQDDEDAAESRPDPAEANLPVAAPPAPRSPSASSGQVLASLEAPPALPLRSAEKPPSQAPSQPQFVATDVHLPTPAPKPAMMLAGYEPQSLPAMTGRSAPAPVAGHDWTIQIGAYADPAVAKAELASYAQHSMDVLGQAARIVAPFESTEGHTLYRARFGPFQEREARAVCQRLTQRGQTCFAAVASR